MGKIVITGASSQIGLAITKKMSGLGMPMMLHCFKNKESLHEWEGRAEIVAADFSKEDELNIFIDKL